jgi:hypothetical protein
MLYNSCIITMTHSLKDIRETRYVYGLDFTLYSLPYDTVIINYIYSLIVDCITIVSPNVVSSSVFSVIHYITFSNRPPI